MSLMDQLTEVVASQVTKSAAQKTGMSEAMTAKMMPIAMAVLMNSLKANAQRPDGAAALATALSKHDGALLNHIDRVSDDNVLADGQKILGHILGGKQQQAEQALAKSAGGMDASQMSALLAMAAPIVLGALGRAKTERNLDNAGLAGLLQEEGQRARQAAPKELSGLMGMLDADGDGDIRNEAMGIGKKLLGGLFKRK
jgi:hypothetical protein